MNIFKILSTFQHIFVKRCKMKLFSAQKVSFFSKTWSCGLRTLFKHTCVQRDFVWEQNREGIKEFHFLRKIKGNAAYFVTTQQKSRRENGSFLIQSLIFTSGEFFLEKTLRSSIAQWICFTKIWKSPPSDKNSQRKCFLKFSCKNLAEFFGFLSTFMKKFRNH